MGIALGAAHFGALHAKGAIFEFGDRFVFERDKKARPSATGIEFCFGRKQRLAATDAFVRAIGVRVPVFAAEGTLGSMLARDVVLLRRELLAPFLGRFGDLVGHVNSL